MGTDPPLAPADDPVDAGQLGDLLTVGLSVAEQFHRSDLVARLRMARARLARSSTLVCVVGEYKAGKSELVNALVGTRVCPVDDDIATSTITIVHAADRPSAKARRVVDGDHRVESIPIDELRRYVTEQGDLQGPDGIELVEVGIPSVDLADGLTLVDTPGVGGLLDHHAAATLRFLGLADAILFVTDASQELTRPEVEFLDRARQVCPHTHVALTKVDLFPEWRRILELDAQHLAARDIQARLLPASAQLWLEPRSRVDADLREESGVAALQEALRSETLAESRRMAFARARQDLEWALQRLLDPLEKELRLLEDPASAQRELERLEAAQARLAELQHGGARWSTVLNDGFTDLRAETTHELRSGIRRVLAAIDDQLEEIDPADDWDPFAANLQERVAELVADVFGKVDDGAARVQRALAELLADDADHPLHETAKLADVAELASADQLVSPGDAASGGPLTTSLTVLRGGSSGMIVLGMVGRLAGIALAAPVSIGVAAAFGAKQFVDTRRQALRQRRQQARQVARQYVDNVQLEADNRLRLAVQERHRLLRDHYVTRLRELTESATAAAMSARQSRELAHEQREQRTATVGAWTKRLREMLDTLPTMSSEEEAS